MAISDEDRPRRFARRRFDGDGHDAGEESLAALHTELVLLREENARLKAAEHKGPDIEGLLGRTRALSAARTDDDSVADETARLLVEGLVIRESLLEICRQIERAMVSFEVRLRALHRGPDEAFPPSLRPAQDAREGGHWSAPPQSVAVNGSNGHGASGV